MGRRTAEQSAASTSTRCKQLAIFLLLNKADFMYRIVVQISRESGQTYMPLRATASRQVLFLGMASVGGS